MNSDTICFIDVWHDHYTNSWVIQRKDSSENQIDKADYVYSKREAIEIANSYKSDSSGLVRIFKRTDGDLQKQY
ncbi:hypothetical protein [Terribacillus saccharophilus]|uniref:hypothetical protein n=1 Tax=Terribacillus saccharophilus TaxID=361277 RepID=UPI002989DC38|nr:hypothetical protein [Terribacillus saccharophilus]MCM3227522.1 hypothetical protein [Terribacillus saccharophilus]